MFVNTAWSRHLICSETQCLHAVVFGPTLLLLLFCRFVVVFEMRRTHTSLPAHDGKRLFGNSTPFQSCARRWVSGSRAGLPQGSRLQAPPAPPPRLVPSAYTALPPDRWQSRTVDLTAPDPAPANHGSHLQPSLAHSGVLLRQLLN